MEVGSEQALRRRSATSSDSNATPHETPPLQKSPSMRISKVDDSAYEFALVFDYDVSPLKRIESKMESLMKHETPMTDDEFDDKYLKQLGAEQRAIVANLRRVGLIVDEIVAVQGKKKMHMKIYYGITASEDKLKDHAERMKLELRLKKKFGHGFLAYSRANEEYFKKREVKYFKPTDRQRIIEHLITAHRRDGGAHLNMPRLITKEIVSKFFPLHQETARKWLIDNWVKRFWRPQPITAVKNYFGEKLALYFVWLGHYTLWLAFASLVGLGTFVSQMIIGYDNNAAFIYSIFISLWSAVFNEFWKRKSAKVAAKWNMVHFEQEERERVGYHGEHRIGVWSRKKFIDLSKIAAKDKRFSNYTTLYYPAWKRFLKIYLAIVPLTIFMLAVVIGTSFGTLLLKSILSVNPIWGSPLGSIINSASILIIEAIWVRLSTILTRWENHRTGSSPAICDYLRKRLPIGCHDNLFVADTEYEDSLIIKRFLFEFVNGYASLFYIAFVKPYLPNWGYTIEWTDYCEPTNQACIMQDLAYNLGFIYVLRIIVLNVLEVVVPAIKSCFGNCCDRRKYHQNTLTHVQHNANLADYEGTVDEYEEMAIQFGYSTLFAAAFPLAPFLQVIHNLVEMRSDAVKFLVFTKRPMWQGAGDIGPYQKILEWMSFVCILTNGSLIVVTGSTFRDITTRLVVFLILENSVWFITYLIQEFIPDIPGRVQRKLAKREFLTREYTNADTDQLHDDWDDTIGNTRLPSSPITEQREVV